jgi:hypothetical protein
VYLQVLGQTDSAKAAVEAAAIDPSLPVHWRRRYPDFAQVEQESKKRAANHLTDLFVGLARLP